MSDRRGFLQKFGALIGIGVASKLPDVVGDGTGFYDTKTVIPNTNLYPMPRNVYPTGGFYDVFKNYTGAFVSGTILYKDENGHPN